jgi:hypothetical protein
LPGRQDRKGRLEKDRLEKRLEQPKKAKKATLDKNEEGGKKQGATLISTSSSSSSSSFVLRKSFFFSIAFLVL